MMQGKGASFRMPKSVGETLDIANFPEAMQDTLAEAFDKDGDGTISADELAEAARLFQQTKANNVLLRRGVCFTAALSMGLVVAIAGVSYGVQEASKETHIQGRALVTKGADPEPVKVGTNELAVPLAALPFLPPEVASKLDSVRFRSADGDVLYHRKAGAVDVAPEKSLKLKTTEGDVISWDVGDVPTLVVTMEDGASWTKDVACTECTATNVFASPDILEGIKNFEDATGMDGRRLVPRCASELVDDNQW